VVNKISRFVEGGMLPGHLQHTRWMMFLSGADREQLYSAAVRAELEIGSARSVVERYFDQASWTDPLARQQYVDVKTYLVDDILTKVDRMSMAASVEARVPLLDHRIVEFALNLPPDMKMRGGMTKVILRQAMAKRLPNSVIRKPKQGFSIPLKHLLRGPMRPLMMETLCEANIRRGEYFRPDCVTRWVSEHLNNTANHSHRLWALMVFEIWRQQASRVQKGWCSKSDADD
jgi:asparagine synthase (glutamine-hydrolysing)